jgi:hypothetical protein
MLTYIVMALAFALLAGLSGGMPSPASRAPRSDAALGYGNLTRMAGAPVAVAAVVGAACYWLAPIGAAPVVTSAPAQQMQASVESPPAGVAIAVLLPLSAQGLLGQSGIQGLDFSQPSLPAAERTGAPASPHRPAARSATVRQQAPTVYVVHRNSVGTWLFQANANGGANS